MATNVSAVAVSPKILQTFNRRRHRASSIRLRFNARCANTLPVNETMKQATPTNRITIHIAAITSDLSDTTKFLQAPPRRVDTRNTACIPAGTRGKPYNRSTTHTDRMPPKAATVSAYRRIWHPHTAAPHQQTATQTKPSYAAQQAHPWLWFFWKTENQTKYPNLKTVSRYNSL